MRNIMIDETIIVKDWEHDMANIEKWILNIVKNEWRCKFIMLDETEFLGIPTCVKNDQIEIYSLDEDLFKSDEKNFYHINDFKSIETIENQIRRYI